MAEALRNGSTGPAVETLQNDLTKLGYVHGATDGIFGPNTETVVNQLQGERGLAVDGIVGPKTWRALKSL